MLPIGLGITGENKPATIGSGWVDVHADPSPGLTQSFFPGRLLAVIDLPEIKNVTLDNLVIHRSMIFNCSLS